MRVRAELQSSGKTTTGFEIPKALVDQLGGGRRPKVSVMVNGHTFRTSIAPMGGRYLLGLSAERREAAGVRAGDVLDLEIALDTESREVELPADFAAALAADATAMAFWETLSYSNRSWHALQVTSAKKPETRAARIAKSLELLRAGRAR